LKTIGIKLVKRLQALPSGDNVLRGPKIEINDNKNDRCDGNHESDDESRSERENRCKGNTSQ
jgi:hypothetical protein